MINMLIIVLNNVIIITLLILMGNFLLHRDLPPAAQRSSRAAQEQPEQLGGEWISRYCHDKHLTCSDKHVPTNKIFLLIKAADQVDVVFIHGLLGGVFYTWRQQDTGNSHELSDDQVREDDYQLEHNPNKKWRQY